MKKFKVDTKIILTFLILTLSAWYIFSLTIGKKEDKTSFPFEGIKKMSISKQREEIRRLISSSDYEKEYEKVKKVYEDDYRSGHNFFHILGEELFDTRGVDGLSFCDDSYGFGCYHGFFTRSLSDNGKKILKPLEEVCKKTSLLYACTHGLGHGSLEYYGRDKIIEALSTCDTLSTEINLYGCKSGVFMEYHFPNVFGTSTGEEKVPFEEENPYSVCHDLPEKFSIPCYYSLANWWRATIEDFHTMGKYCQELQDYFSRRSCFLGIGNEVSPTYENDLEKSINGCKLMPSLEGQTVCSAAVYVNFLTKDKESVDKACEWLPKDQWQSCKDYSIVKELRE